MTQEIDQPGKIYNLPHDGSCPTVQPFTLTELMHGIPDHENYLVNNGSCLVLGVQNIPQDAAEFNVRIQEELDKTITKYKKTNPNVTLDDEQITRVNRFLRENYVRVSLETTFRAYRHVNEKGISISDSMSFQGILTDFEWLAILYFDTQDITILPYGKTENGLHSGLFSDARGKIAPSVWGYAGTLGSALSEFHGRGFAFSVAKLPTTPEGWEQLGKQNRAITTTRRLISGVMTDTNVPLEQVLGTISQNPLSFTI